MQKLSKKAGQALAHMQGGAYWRKQLETQWVGGRFGYRKETFVTRLRDAKGRTIKGFGIKTFFEMEEANLLQWRECSRSSTWPTEHVLRVEQTEAAA